MTPAAQAVRRLLALRGPSTTDQLHETEPCLSRVTICRALRKLEAAGLVTSRKVPRRKGRPGARPRIWRVK